MASRPHPAVIAPVHRLSESKGLKDVGLIAERVDARREPLKVSSILLFACMN